MKQIILVETPTDVRRPRSPKFPKEAVLLSFNGTTIVCQDKAHKKLLKTRIKAYQKSGNPNYRQCNRCKCWDSPDNMIEKESIHSVNGKVIKVNYLGLYHKNNELCNQAIKAALSRLSQIKED